MISTRGCGLPFSLIGPSEIRVDHHTWRKGSGAASRA
jgi:hypothetical protein